LVAGSLPALDVLQMNSLQDFEVTAWDLLPYSFLVDYFTNIGDIIHASTFTAYNLDWGVQTSRTRIESTYSFNAIPDFLHNPAIVYTENWCKGGNSSISSTTFVRNSITAASLIPEFRVSLPTSAKPWENIGALLVSRYADKLVPFYNKLKWLRSVPTD
jgi:hypothetical protein